MRRPRRPVAEGLLSAQHVRWDSDPVTQPDVAAEEDALRGDFLPFSFNAVDTGGVCLHKIQQNYQ